MTPVLIVTLVIVVVAVVALVVANPGLKKKEADATEAARDSLGGDKAVQRLDSRVTGMGTEPEEAGGLRGMGVLALSDDALVFVTWSGPTEFRIDRSAVQAVEVETDDPTTASKLTLHVRYATDDGEATALFRVSQPVSWLKLLPYDWGPDGPPEDEPVDDEL